jgi:cytoskeletal protein RodZ
VFLLSDLGLMLKEAREAKNITLDELQSLTKIQKRYLKGIEEGNYSVMPGKFYVRAFIKQYCEAIGLDSEEIFEEYKKEIPVSHTEELPSQLSRVRTKRQISTKGSKVFDLLPKILLTVFIVGGLVAIWFFWQTRDIADEPITNSNNEQTEFEQPEDSKLNKEEETITDTETEEVEPATDEVAQEEETPVEETAPASEIVLKEKSGMSAVYELKTTDVFTLDVSAIPNGETWVGIKNAKGKTFYSGLMKDGLSQQFDFSKETDIRLNIGRTLDTVVKVNGQLLEFPFDPNEKVQQRITILFSPTVQ